MNLKNKKVVVVGFGVTGRAALVYLHQRKAFVYLSDKRHRTNFSKADLEFIDSYVDGCEFGGHSDKMLLDADILIVSPGINCNDGIFKKAEQKNIALLGELAFVNGIVDKPIIAVTGTNGKTTVTSLITDICEYSGMRVFTGGNIGNSVFEYLCDPYEIDVLVLEVSSFQLLTARGFRPDVALILNITPDHLDRHGDFVSYAQAKKLIFKNQSLQDSAIVFDNDECQKSVKGIHSKVLTFGETKKCNAYVDEEYLYLETGTMYEPVCLEGSQLARGVGGLNAAAAALATFTIGCSVSSIKAGLINFCTPAHRMEHVANLNGVQYINDSKATNTGAVIKALESINGKIILIAGGSEKGDDYSLMRDIISQKVSELILLGATANRFSKEMSGAVKITKVSSMKEAVKTAKNIARLGETILLSPACASFDMYDSYSQRGDDFTKCVKNMEN